jgi:hypothetical protein
MAGEFSFRGIARHLAGLTQFQNAVNAGVDASAGDRDRCTCAGGSAGRVDFTLSCPIHSTDRALAESLRAFLNDEGLIYSDDMIEAESGRVIGAVIRWLRTKASG